MGPWTKQIEIGLCKQAKESAFSNHKSHTFLHVYIYIFHILEFPGIISFPEITRKRSGFPRSREISFKVETLSIVKGQLPCQCCITRQSYI